MTSSKPITLIVADDHPGVRRSLCTLLEADGHFAIVAEAENGLEAVRMARVFSPDAILMDISMPRLNGLEATRRIVAANPSARVIILSAYSDGEYLQRAKTVGAAGMLAKQAFSGTLARTIRDVVVGRGFFGPSLGRRPARARGRSHTDPDGSIESSVELTII